MAKSNSLTGVITPVKTPALKRIGQSISVALHTSTHRRAPTHLSLCNWLFCVREWNSSAPFAAVHQFSHWVPTFDPGPAASSHEGLVVSAPAQQPVLEWHRGESRPHGEGDQASGGERWWGIFKNQTTFRRIHHNATHFGWHVGLCAGPRSQCGQGDKCLLLISVK